MTTLNELGESAERRANAQSRAHIAATRAGVCVCVCVCVCVVSFVRFHLSDARILQTNRFLEIQRRLRSVAKRFADALHVHQEAVRHRRSKQRQSNLSFLTRFCSGCQYHPKETQAMLVGGSAQQLKIMQNRTTYSIRSQHRRLETFSAHQQQPPQTSATASTAAAMTVPSTTIDENTGLRFETCFVNRMFF
jgi:hypothetical protein